MRIARRKPVEKERLVAIVEQFAGKRIVVVGDIMLDEFIWGTVSRISPEAPVPVVEVQRKSIHLGGAGNVGCNLAALGALPMPVGVIGESKQDGPALKLLEEYNRYSGKLTGLIQETGRFSTVKTRIIAHNQQVCRADTEDRRPFRKTTLRRLLSAHARLAPLADGTIISDYAKGVLSLDLVRAMQQGLDKGRPGLLAVDPKSWDFRIYGRATVLTPNKREAELASGITIQRLEDLERAGKKILKRIRSSHLIITRGEEGMSVFSRDGSVTHIPTFAREVFDVTGAGDTVIATLTLALASGAGITEAAVIANFAAGVVVGKLGTATVSAAELCDRLERDYPGRSISGRM